MSDVSVVCASSCLGLTPMQTGSFWAAIERRPSAVVADAGTADAGGQYLGTGEHLAPAEWERHDLRLMLLATRRLGIPMIVGSVGGAGTSAAVDQCFRVLGEIASEEGLGKFTAARIYAEIDRPWLAEQCRRRDIRGLGITERLTSEAVESCPRVVAMMGVEPVVKALEQGADVVIAGRSCDDAIFAAVPIFHGKDRGLSLHMGKAIECGPLVATPMRPREAVMGTVRDSDFLVEPFHPEQRCTPASVAGHTLYERIDPLKQELPGGYVDLTDTRFEVFNERVCRVTGSRWVATEPYRVKLEGSCFAGHRAYVMFGLRDPRSIHRIDDITSNIRKQVEAKVTPLGDGAHLNCHVYGKDAIMKGRERKRSMDGHEVCVVIEVVHRDRKVAGQMANLAKYLAFRADYPGKATTAGTGAMMADEVLWSPHPIYRWTIDHLLPVEEGDNLFPMRLDVIG
jgi:hypothetical protein